MSAFAWAMLALGLFLVLYTVAFLLRPASDGRARRDSLGCGFVLLAGIVWSVALTNYLGERNAGMRMGFGCALILPALVALFKPGARRRIVPAAVLFIVAILLASSALPKLRARMRPTAKAADIGELRLIGQDLQVRIGKAQTYVASLERDEIEVRRKLSAKAYADFEAAADDPEGMRLLRELAEIKRLRGITEARLAQDRLSRERIESATRRAERLAQAETIAGDAVSDSEIAAILREASQAAEPSGPATVETHLERGQLAELFNKEFGD